MRFLVFVWMLLLIPFAAYTQLRPCDDGEAFLYKVTAPSGLNMREKAQLDAPKLITIPYQGEIYTCSYCRDCGQATIEGVEGMWRKVYYQGQIGYIFDAYLEKSPSIDFICADEWLNYEEKPHSYLKEGLNYYAIYSENDSEEARVIPLTSDEPLEEWANDGKARYVDIDPDNAPTFIVGGLPLEGQYSVKGKSNQGQLYPGQSIFLYTSYLYAKGQVEMYKNNKHAYQYPFAKIKDFELILRKLETPYQEQSIIKMDLHAWVAGGYEGHVKVLWYGDLDLDGTMDLLLSYSTHYAGWEVILLLSSRADKGYLVGEAARKQFPKY